jgi:hypothetical protein
VADSAPVRAAIEIRQAMIIRATSSVSADVKQFGPDIAAVNCH